MGRIRPDREATFMRSIAGAIILLGASICFSAGLLGKALAKEAGESILGMAILAAIIFGVIGVVILFAGMLEKRE